MSSPSTQPFPQLPHHTTTKEAEVMGGFQSNASQATTPTSGKFPASAAIITSVQALHFSAAARSEAASPTSSSTAATDTAPEADKADMDTQEDVPTNPTTTEASPEPSPTSSNTTANDGICKCVANCNTGSDNLRKVISQYFGRNKRETRSIPEAFWEKWCRKHYQRMRYRRGLWIGRQVMLIHDMIDKLEESGKVRGWTVTIRKTEEKKLRDPAFKEHLREQDLLKYVGKGKSFEYVREFIDKVHQQCTETEAADLPHFQLLPDIDTYPIKDLDAGCFAEQDGSQTWSIHRTPTPTVGEDHATSSSSGSDDNDKEASSSHLNVTTKSAVLSKGINASKRSQLSYTSKVASFEASSHHKVSPSSHHDFTPINGNYIIKTAGDKSAKEKNPRREKKITVRRRRNSF